MALQMSFTEDGTRGTQNINVPHPASYWEIDDFTVSLIHGGSDMAVTIVEFDGWHDKATHDAGDGPFFTKRYELPPAPIDYSLTIGNGFAALYAAAQAIPEPDTGQSFFFGAVSV